MKRICVYLTYDQQKVVDKYIGYMLMELKTCVDYLVVVCNETEVIQGNEILVKYADKIFYRENIGFDVGGFKDALCKYIGWDNLLKYDELVLANDSMFGPFKPMKDIFSEMDRRNVDFWGLIKHGEALHETMGYIPEHIQTFFCVIRSKMLHCLAFKEYWESMPYYKTFHHTVVGHEIKFTQFFKEKGYNYSVLADVEKNDSSNIRNNYSQYESLSYELIQKRNFPFLKKKQIVRETLEVQTQENLQQAINYIDKRTTYDVELIWENIIRTFNVTDLQRNLHLQYIISPEQNKFFEKTVVFLIFLQFENSFAYVFDYLERIRSLYPVKIFSNNRKCLEPYQNYGYETEKLYSDDTVTLLSRFTNYDLVCVLHDADMESDREPSYIGKSYFYNIWENLAKDQSHILGIVHLFSKENRLGFLTSPQPNFGKYFGEYGKKWDGNDETVIRIIQECKLNCQVSGTLAPFRVSNNFWIRSDILKKVNCVKIEDTNYLPYLWVYFAQDAGYYSGIVESPDYASMNERNLQYYLQEITFQIRKYIGKFNTPSEMTKAMCRFALNKYCEKYKKIFIYGAGQEAELYQKDIPNIEGYIVSDGQEKQEELNGFPVKYLSEIQELEKYGIVLCLNEKNQKEVIPYLEVHGIRHYFCV